MEKWKAEWIEHLGEYRIFNVWRPYQTIAYIDAIAADIEEAKKKAAAQGAVLIIEKGGRII